METVFVTGTAGFIGFHLAKELLHQGYRVVGFDGFTDYYDVNLKRARNKQLLEFPAFEAHEGMLQDRGTLRDRMRLSNPDVVVHLAAQAGVRHSIENPRSYLDSNITGTFNVMENAKDLGVKHLLMASTSSVYGANTQMPFEESQPTETPLSLYAATKRANEAMAHSYAHLWQTPTTMFRFFSVYGSWGRPDLALFKFVKAAYAGEAIDVYNHGRMSRDFTYVADLARSIRHLIETPPAMPNDRSKLIKGDTISPAAPFRVVNIGNGKQVPLMRFIQELERALGFDIDKNMLDMQIGDVAGTWANTDLLVALTGYRPSTEIRVGIARFVEWYNAYYGVPKRARTQAA